MTVPLLELDRLSITYPNATVRSADGVSFCLHGGEILGLVGESGCGKSTLGRAAIRLLPEGSRTEGAIRFRGESVLDFDAERLRQFRGEAVALVFQDPMTRLDPLMTIGDHCLETLRAHRPKLDRATAQAKALDTLKTVKIPPERWAQYPHEFSGGMRQRVAIALALLLDPKLIVADEPTTSLDVTVSAQILDELSRLCRERDLGLLLISHDLAMVAQYSDRVAVMNGGQLVECDTAETVLQTPKHPYTQSLLEAALHLHAIADREAISEPSTDDSATAQTPTSQALSRSENDTSSTTSISATDPRDVVIRAINLTQHYTLAENPLAALVKRLRHGKAHPGRDRKIRAVDGLNFEIFQGEILGLVGESGCGKSTLSRTLLQLIPPTSGRVEFLGRDITQLSRQDLRQQRRQMQMVFQDPHACLNPMMTIGEAIADPLLVHHLADTVDAAKDQVLAMLDRVGLEPEFYDRYPDQLSGGQQQRVAIARALITRPKFVICDEPVSMLDANVQSRVLDLMRDLKDEFQLTYLFITHDLWVARYFCDRIAVMHGGKIVELGETQSVFHRPQHPYTQTLLGAAPLLSRTATSASFNP
ncbi:MAG: ABC transporter ATP-binding protein [Oscillatoriales cyanobacterium]|nr:MAG: ABC transporter ATP-binding protein [Oscillatoriales cyanobacterium]